MNINRPLRILQVNVSDIQGGAERIAWTLFKGCQKAGHEVSFAVGIKHTADPDVLKIPNNEAHFGWGRWCWNLHDALVKRNNHPRGTWRLSRLARIMGDPRALLDEWRGGEDWNFQGLSLLLSRMLPKPDIIHLHNLHGQYFDLRTLAALSHQGVVVLTLHDEWAFTGCCIYSVACDRWRTGCGECPLLHSRPSILPCALRQDGTRANWHQKKNIYLNSRLYVASPSAWLMRRAEQSILAPAIVQGRVIANGVDVNLFRPHSRVEARVQLGLPSNAIVVLSVAAALNRNLLKGYVLMREATRRAALALPGRQVIFLAVGAKASSEIYAGLEIHSVPFNRDPRIIAAYYQAADLYLHGARSDNFPTTVLEALACGLPVVATAVGGVPEQVNGAPVPNMQFEYNGRVYNQDDHAKANGIIVPPDDVNAMSHAIEYLLRNDRLRRTLSDQAIKTVSEHFSLNCMTNTYLDWYHELVSRTNAN